MSTMLLEIVTPERKVFSEPVDMISVKGTEGELGILPNHIPLVTPLRIAPVKVTQNGREKTFAIGGGFMEVRKDKVSILAESAELPEEIDIDRAKAARQRAEERLRQNQEALDYKRAELALQRAMTRIEVYERK
ncbi:F0F1 ATP synthase subunit epsilon [Paenibacillus turpanensis]|uniref:F0F1 ATP synthase subunit epsilon n=1 Tax=Paenibacillus turpanensis TaxID=2689078 RepID=UPI0014082AAC|nr:F0F1 ATP synthase subunit epsilon [Paenibacillus turpanensis]